VVSVLENRIYHLTDGSRFVGRTINIVHRDGVCKGSGSELVLPNESRSMKSPSAPQSRRAFMDLVSWVSVVTISTLMFREFAEGWWQPHTSVEAVFPTFQADWVSRRGLRSWQSFQSLLHVLSSHFVSQIC